MKGNSDMQVAIYSRKSKYVQESKSVENQIEMCRKYIFSHMEKVEEKNITVYEDEGFSGKNTERPSFQRMLCDCRKHPFYAIVCYRLDRISRSVSDFSSLVEFLNKQKVALVCIKEQFDTATPMGRAMMYMASVFAQLERETIAQRVQDNMYQLARSGRWLGGTVPTGFFSAQKQLIVWNGKQIPVYTLQAKEDGASVVTTIYEEFLRLQTLSGVKQSLKERNVFSFLEKEFSLDGIKGILTNPVYCAADERARTYFCRKGAQVCFKESDCTKQRGLIAYHKRDYTKEKGKRMDVSQWIIAIGAHKSMIPSDIWIQVQEILQKNKQKKTVRNFYAAFSGILYCAKCGGRMLAKKRYQKDEFDYICENKMRGGKRECDSKNLIGKKTDQMLRNALRPFFTLSPAVFEKQKRLVEKRVLYKKSALEQIERQKERCRRETDALLQVLAKKETEEPVQKEIQKRLLILAERKEELTKEKEKVLAQKGEVAMREEQIKHLLLTYRDYLEQIPLPQQREVFKRLIKKGIWNGKNIEIWLQ